MTHICSHCRIVSENSGNYCSDHCRHEAERRLFLIMLASIAGVLVLIFTIYTTPSEELPTAPISISEVEDFSTSGARPICTAIGKVNDKTCLGGKISSMGASIEDSHCDGKNWIVCAACKGAGKVRDALVSPASPERL